MHANINKRRPLYTSKTPKQFSKTKLKVQKQSPLFQKQSKNRVLCFPKQKRRQILQEMKVPTNSNQLNQINTTKPNRIVTNLYNYEPKSVLDIRRSPSPHTATIAIPKPETIPFSDTIFDNPISLEEQVLNNFEDWDSLIPELGLHEDSTIPQSEIVPNFSYIEGRNLFDQSFRRMNDEEGIDFVDELIRSADCFEFGECHLAQAILTRLGADHQLQAPLGKPLQRASFYFKEALQSLLIGSTRQVHRPDIVDAIKAYKCFSNVSPVIMFSNFTANQAILEAVDGSLFVHIIDFDIGFGGQWASFMKEVSDRALSRKTNSPVLRISAVVPEDYAVESRLIEDNLNQFSRGLNLAFEMEFISIQTFEYLSFKAIKFMEGEKTAVMLSPVIFRSIGVGILNDLRQLSPHVTVMVDGEGLTNGDGTGSFRRSLIDGLEFYSTIMESLEAAGTGGGDEWIRNIEMNLLRPKIIAAVEGAGRRSPPWREAFAVVGMRPVMLSQFTDFQAECLLRKVQVRGFHVAKQHAELILCWQDRAMVATSAWRC